MYQSDARCTVSDTQCVTGLDQFNVRLILLIKSVAGRLMVSGRGYGSGYRLDVLQECMEKAILHNGQYSDATR